MTPDSSLLKRLPALKSKSYLQLSISDTGIGMDEATMEHIFEPFFTTKPLDKGTGLGLSVVHGIISSYEGEITVESRPGEATSFRIYLPVIDQKIGDCVSDTIIPNGSGHILFVDDEQVILDMITRMLTKIGFCICAMKQPSQALEIVKMNPERFDLAITDLTMPEMNGIDFATELHKICSRIPIILMSGYGNDVQKTIALEKSGICKTLKKPVRLAELASAINEALGKGCA
jgi:CheY-like chemotaxis protein